MMKLRWDPVARENITNIFRVYKDRHGLQTATKIINAIRKSVQRLKKEPYLGFKEPALLTNPAGYRSLIEGNYKIIYCIEPENFIRIVTIFDCRQAPEKLDNLF